MKILLAGASLSFDFSTNLKSAKNYSTLRIDNKEHKEAKNNAKIDIRLLTPFAEVGGGIYKLDSVKNVKGTEAFLDMKESERACNHEKAEECKNRKMLEKCKCVPWELKSIQVV